jgi:hypothetical protein
MASPVMPQPPNHSSTWVREELLHLLSLSGTMAGLCITGVTLFHTVGRSSTASTVADDMLAGCAMLFLLCTYVTFFALRTRKPGLAVTLEKAVDVLFSIALTAMVATGFVMAYTVW